MKFKCWKEVDHEHTTMKQHLVCFIAAKCKCERVQRTAFNILPPLKQSEGLPIDPRM